MHGVHNQNISINNALTLKTEKNFGFSYGAPIDTSLRCLEY